MFKRVLISTDLSDGLVRLGKFLPSLAAGGMEHIVFVHSVPLWTKGQIPREDTEKISLARDRLNAILNEVPEGLQVEVEVRSGNPTENILKAAEQYKSEVIILGASNRNLLSEQLFGSTTLNLSGRTNIPLMTIPTALISPLTSEELDLRCRHLFRYILLPYADTQASGVLIKEFKRYAQNRPPHSLERCMLAWVIDAGVLRNVPKDYKLKEAHEKLAPIQTELEAIGLQVDVEVRLGEPVLDILDLTQMSDISAVALASNSLGKIVDWFPSFAAEVLRRSCEPVIFFPSRR
ncbi:universal stress protein [Laspinema olomoucense]|uniref:Universal stress protein n=1 Tax=Laspinema olomoucense D3b TaxID=2953688 RepID=A0ABT2N3Z2_9CYAN|nr:MULTISPECIES: universal stress protein [unclassified Laspinema]MCT7977191.1 universal stress protein [Laspinema sp. D3b]MCT7987942.1 universal stress protein [Laspinema sp. D3a]